MNCQLFCDLEIKFSNILLDFASPLRSLFCTSTARQVLCCKDSPLQMFENAMKMLMAKHTMKAKHKMLHVKTKAHEATSGTLFKYWVKCYSNGQSRIKIYAVVQNNQLHACLFTWVYCM